MFCSVPNTPGPLQTLIDNDSVECNHIERVIDIIEHYGGCSVKIELKMQTVRQLLSTQSNLSHSTK